MPTPSTAKWPKPRSEDEFEDIVVDFLRIRWKDPNAQRHGRRGQRQHGVDVLGRPSWLKGRTAGGQSKNTDVLTLADVVAEATKALTFPGGIAEFYVVTSGDRDVQLQTDVREHFRANPAPFHIEVIFWPDVVADVSADDTLVAKHWKGFGPQAAGAATLGGPIFLDRDGAHANEVTECHSEFSIRSLALPDLDATELLAEVEKAAQVGPTDIAPRHLLQQHPVATSTGYSWSGTHRAYANVLDKWSMDIANAGHVTKRWSRFSTHDMVLFETFDLVEGVVLPLNTYSAAVDAWLAALGGDQRSKRVALRLSAQATKSMKLHDNVNIVASTARFSSPVSPETWQVELEEDLSVGPARVALRLLNRVVARFIEEPDRWAGQNERKLVRIDEDAYAACLKRLGL